jgi:hypothetical protein
MVSIGTSFRLPRSEEDLTMSSMATGFQVKDFGDKGNGFVATEDFPLGTRIISETPHKWFTSTQSLKSIASMLGIGVGSVYNTRTTNEMESALPPHVRQMEGLPRTVPSPQLHKNGGDVPAQNLEQFASANILPAKSLSGDAMMVNYLNTICHINHACFPNAEYSWNTKLQKGVIHAVCNISAGDKVTINYGFEMHQCHLIREKFGFICLCNTCKSETSSPGLSHSRV